MSGVFEGLDKATDSQEAGPAGLRTLSNNQIIRFTQYVRHVLPLDGYVFWLRTKHMHVKGSLHVSTDKRQNEDETIAINRIVFTTGEEIQEFNEIGPNLIWVGEWFGTKFAFSKQNSFYRAAGVYHYVGDAVYPAMATQLVDVGDELDDKTLIVSNSLPLWLTLINYNPIWLNPPNPKITLYPSFAVPDNLRPPYGSVHIEPNTTVSMQTVSREAGGYSTQLSGDNVRVTLYGLTNNQALDFQSLVLAYSYDTDNFGIMNMPAIRDEKRTQAELGILAMKKTIEFDVSYFQTRTDVIAQQQINTALATIYPIDYPIPQFIYSASADVTANSNYPHQYSPSPNYYLYINKIS